MDESSVEYKVEDKSKDREYFILTPQLVWALCRDPYDFILWSMAKMIAGEEGECYIGDRALAKMCMMSVGKANDCRQYLTKIGLLHGELRKRPEKRHPVWHLTVPDIWEQNVAWRKKYNKLWDRLAFKKGFLSGRIKFTL